MNQTRIKYSLKAFLIVILFSMGMTSCKKYLNIPPPTNKIAGSAAFANDNSTSGVVTGLFSSMSYTGYFTGAGGIAFASGLYCDELSSLNVNNSAIQTFYLDALQAGNANQWSALYADLYQANVAIEGIKANESKLFNKDQWLGECYFSRALLFFYITNLYGEAALPLSSDRLVNGLLARVPQAQVYQQIISDLLQAQTLLSDSYKDGFGNTTTDRARPNRNAATALLAKVYLYAGNWAGAEGGASTLINNASYQLEPLQNVFLSNSKELIWGLAPLVPDGIVSDYKLYSGPMPAQLPAGQTPFNYGISAALNNDFVNSFESGDQRFSQWIRPVNLTPAPLVGGASYYFPAKYKSAVSGAEYLSMLRLAEQYLIRAEARVMQNNLDGALADLNLIRSRAGLGASAVSTKSDILQAILKERRAELFTESGNRLFDLRRTGNLDKVMANAIVAKGATWSTYKQYWPIPPGDLVVDPFLVQTPGY
ncbi:MAG: RagB/SusD family nutrient uptake outer membrane protein [Bacteroidota bacterium]